MMHHLACIAIVVMLLMKDCVAQQQAVQECRDRFVGKDEGAVPTFQSDGKVTQKEVTSRTVDIAVSINSFSFKLLRTIQGDDRETNAVISPLSISLAFSLVHDLATPGSETKGEIANTLGFDSDECYGVLLRDSLTGLLSTDASNGIELLLASKIFVDNDLEVGESLQSDVLTTDFAKPSEAAADINEFVAEATQGEIKSVLDASSLDPTTVMTIVNALFFKGEWANKFDTKETKEGVFTRADGTEKIVKFMEQEAEFRLSRSSTPVGSLLELPYRGQRFAMYLYLPKDAEAMDEFLSGLSYETWRELIKNMRKSDVVVKLPKFDIESSLDLHNIFPTMSPAMKRVFTLQAELDEIADGAYVGSAIHKAKLKVNEEGTTAAAVTVATVQPLSAPPSFTADKPFLYFVADKKNGDMILFMGSVMNP